MKPPAGWIADGERSGRGGQATTFHVCDGAGREGVYRQLKGRVTAKARERFRREVGILSGGLIQHRSVVRLLGWDASADRPWYISERGDPFDEWWRNWKEGQADPEDVVTKAVDVVRQLAGALGACHQHGIVHRDVKPSNLVVKRGEEESWADTDRLRSRLRTQFASVDGLPRSGREQKVQSRSSALAHGRSACMA